MGRYIECHRTARLCRFSFQIIILVMIFHLAACGLGDSGASPGVVINNHDNVIIDENGGSHDISIHLAVPPQNTVSVRLLSQDPGEVSVDPESLEFSVDEWDSPQTVTLIGVDDLSQDGSQNADIEIDTSESADTIYSLLAKIHFKVTVSDDDSSSVLFKPSQIVLAEGEEDGSGQLFIRLSSLPQSPVNVNFQISDVTEAIFWKTDGGESDSVELAFNDENWNQFQSVMLTPKSDDTIDGNQSIRVDLEVASEDSSYDGYKDSIEVTVKDTDQAGFTFSKDNVLDTDESGKSDKLFVSLNTKPSSEVTITLESSDEGEGALSNATLSFSPENYSVEQEVEIIGVDDAIDDGVQKYTVSISAATSDDENYNGIQLPGIDAYNIDDEPGISVYPFDELRTDEGGAVSVFYVKMNTAPASDVILALSSTNENEAKLRGGNSPVIEAHGIELYFTPQDWGTTRKVEVFGQNDDLADGLQSFEVVFQASHSDDPIYKGITPSSLPGKNADNDTPGITIDPTRRLRTSENGLSDRFSVKLNSKPSDVVVIDLETSDFYESVLSTKNFRFAQKKVQLIFTSEDWQTPQSVGVFGVNDVEVDGNTKFQISVAVNVEETKDDSGYVEVASQVLVGINSDDDSPVEERCVDQVGFRELDIGQMPLIEKGCPQKSAYFYFVSGLKPDQFYIAELESVVDGISLISSANNAHCHGKSVYDEKDRKISCPVFVGSEGSFWIGVYLESVNEEFSLSLREHDVQPYEGTTSSPVEIGSYIQDDYEGITNAHGSFFQISDLSPGEFYQITLKSARSNVLLHEYGMPDSSGIRCIRERSEIPTEKCYVRATEHGQINFRVASFSIEEEQAISLSYEKYIGIKPQKTVYAQAQELPINVKVSRISSSEVTIEGLIDDQIYLAEVTNITSGGYLSVYSYFPGGVYLGCSDLDENSMLCAFKANSHGELGLTLYSRQDHESLLLNVSPYSGLRSEGKRYLAKQLIFLDGELHHQGKIGVESSYYRIEGLDPTQSYSVYAESGGDALYTLVSTSDEFTDDCFGRLPYHEDAKCTIVPNRNGQIWIRVRNRGINPQGKLFNLRVVEQEAIFFLGTKERPVSVYWEDSETNFADTVGNGPRYYQISGFRPNTDYQYDIQSDDSYLSINQFSGIPFLYGDNVCGWVGYPCLITSDNTGTLWLSVSSGSTGQEDTFAIKFSEYQGLPSQGTYSEHMLLDYSAGFSHPGTVSSRSSYYTIRNLQPGTTYIAKLSSEEYDLSLVDIGNYYQRYCAPGRLHSRICFIEPDENGEIDLLVPGSSDPSGVSFDLTVEPYDGPKSEGTELEPKVLKVIDGQLDYSTKLGYNKAYYQIGNIVAGELYKIEIDISDYWSRIELFEKSPGGLGEITQYCFGRNVSSNVDPGWSCIFSGEEVEDVRLVLDGVQTLSGVDISVRIEQYRGQRRD